MDTPSASDAPPHSPRELADAPRKRPWISRPWLVAMFLFVAAGLNYADRTALASVIPLLREDLKITDAQMGWVGLLFLWSYAIASPLAGNLADRFSRTKLIVLSLVLWSVVTILTGFVGGVMALFFLRIALGLSESMYLPASGALLGDHHGPATRGKAMGFHMLGLNLGLVIGGSGAGVLAEHFGWRLGFWVLGGAGLLLAAVSPFFLADATGGRKRTAEPGAQRSGPAKKTAARQAWLYLLKVPSFYCLLVSAMAAGVASWMFMSWLPLFFAENYEMNLGAAGLAGVAMYKAPVFVGIAIGGWLSDKVIQRNPRGRVLLKALSFLVSSPFLLLFIGAPTFLLVAVTMMISSSVRAIGLPSEHPIICEVVPSQYRSTAIGIFNTFGSLAGGVGVLVAGLLKKTLGLNLIFGTSAFIYVLAGALLLLAYWFFVNKDMARAKEHEIVPVDA